MMRMPSTHHSLKQMDGAAEPGISLAVLPARGGK